MAWVTEFFEMQWRPAIVVLASLVVLSYGTLDLLHGHLQREMAQSTA
jgi:hypothetical protein